MDPHSASNAPRSNSPSIGAPAARARRSNGTTISYAYAYDDPAIPKNFYDYPANGATGTAAPLARRERPLPAVATHHPGFFLTSTAISSYTYAGSSGITKGDVFAKPHPIGRTVRRYSDSDQSVARTIIPDVDIFSGNATEFSSMTEINRMVNEELRNLDLDEALYIRELSRSITMGPIIPGTQTREIRLALAPDFAHEDV